MSTLALSNESQSSQSDVTKISANSRIDYILRFSKQAILVIDDKSNVYSQVGHQFLAEQAVEQNAAFVTVSSKHNDIQLRCRIVEQLFGSSLFDPEQSLAVSVYNLANEAKMPISIVLEHCQHLSLQIFHELCQLVEIANKRKITINVIFLGNQVAGQTVAEHKSLFDKKLTIISAESGQVIPLSSKALKLNNQNWQLSIGTKIILAITLFSALLVGAMVVMYKQDVFNFAAVLKGSANPEKSQLTEQEVPVNVESVKSSEDVLLSKNILTTTQPKLEKANTEEIFQALVNSELKVEKPVEHASPQDIIAAISLTSNETPLDKGQLNGELKSSLSTVEVENNAVIVNEEILAPSEQEVTTTTVSFNRLDNQYYLSQEKGFVIQFAGFSDESGYQNFANENNSIQHMAYQRLLAEKPFITVTSIVFETRSAAQAQIDTFNEQMPDRGLWIKPLNIIKDEINYFQSSQ